MDFCAYLIKIANRESVYDPALADDIARAATGTHSSGLPVIPPQLALASVIPSHHLAAQLLYPLSGLGVALAGGPSPEQSEIRDFLNYKRSKIQAEKLRDASVAAKGIFPADEPAISGGVSGATTGALLGYYAPELTRGFNRRFMTYSRHPYAGALIGGGLGGLGSYLYMLLKQKKLRETIEEAVKLHGMKTAADDNELLKRKAKVNLWRLADELRALSDVKEKSRGNRINRFREKYEQTTDSVLSRPAFVAAGSGIASMGVGRFLSDLAKPRYEKSMERPVVMSRSTGLAPFTGAKERIGVLSANDKPIGSVMGMGPDKLRVIAHVKAKEERFKPSPGLKWRTFDVTRKHPLGSKFLGKIGPSLNVAIPVAMALLGAGMSMRARDKNKEELMRAYALLGPEEKAMAKPLI